MNVSIYCPHCHRHTALSPAPVEVERGYDTMHVAAVWRKSQYQHDTWWIGVCNFCDEPCLVRSNGVTVYPNPIPQPTDERVPEAIRKDLDEAKSCFQVNAYCGAAVMARRVIQQVAIDKGCTGGNLVNQIEQLASNGTITNDIKEWATVVRWVGNDAAHPNPTPVEEADAKDIIDLAEQLLQIVYVAPAIAQNRRQERGR
ncbi:MAG: DUF4145 domain-containing protein [Planctomycetota bacterium]